MPSVNINKGSTSTRVGNWGGRLEKRAKSTKVKDCAAERDTDSGTFVVCVVVTVVKQR